MDSLENAALKHLLVGARNVPLTEARLRSEALPAYKDVLSACGAHHRLAHFDVRPTRLGNFMLSGDHGRVDWLWIKIARLLSTGCTSIFDASPSTQAAEDAFISEKKVLEALGVQCRLITANNKHPGICSGQVVDYGTAFVAALHELMNKTVPSLLGRGELPTYQVCVRVLDALLDEGNATVALPSQAALSFTWSKTLIRFISSIIEPNWEQLTSGGHISLDDVGVADRQLSGKMQLWLSDMWGDIPSELADKFKPERHRFFALASAYIYAKATWIFGDNYVVDNGEIKLVYGHGKAAQKAASLSDDVYAVLAERHQVPERQPKKTDFIHPVTWCEQQDGRVAGVVSQSVRRAMSHSFGKTCKLLKPSKKTTSVNFCSGRAIQSLKISEALTRHKGDTLILINDTSLRHAFAGLPDDVLIRTHREVVTSECMSNPDLTIIEIEPAEQEWGNNLLKHAQGRLVRIWSDEDGRYRGNALIAWRAAVTKAIIDDNASSKVENMLKGYQARRLEQALQLFQAEKVESVLRYKIRESVHKEIAGGEPDTIPTSLVSLLGMSPSSQGKVLGSMEAYPEILQHLWLSHWGKIVGAEDSEGVFDRIGTVLSQDLWEPNRQRLSVLKATLEVLNEKSI